MLSDFSCSESEPKRYRLRVPEKLGPNRPTNKDFHGLSKSQKLTMTLNWNLNFSLSGSAADPVDPHSFHIKIQRTEIFQFYEILENFYQKLKSQKIH